MPPPAPNFPDTMAEVDKLIGVLTDAEPGLPPTKEAELFRAVLGKLKEARAAADDIVPQSLNQLKQYMEGVQAAADRLRADLTEQMRRHDELAAQAAGPASPPPPPPADPPTPPLDPELGRTLRADLLRSVTPDTDADGPFRPGKDIWQDWK